MCNNIRTLILAALTLSQCYVEKKEVTEIGGYVEFEVKL